MGRRCLEIPELEPDQTKPHSNVDALIILRKTGYWGMASEQADLRDCVHRLGLHRVHNITKRKGDQ